MKSLSVLPKFTRAGSLKCDADAGAAATAGATADSTDSKKTWIFK